MSDNMYNLDGWREVTCGDSDRLRYGLTPVSSLTDIDGTYGKPIQYTEWARGDEPVLRDYRWWDGTPCKHYVPVGTEPEGNTEQ